MGNRNFLLKVDEKHCPNNFSPTSITITRSSTGPCFTATNTDAVYLRVGRIKQSSLPKQNVPGAPTLRLYLIKYIDVENKKTCAVVTSKVIHLRERTYEPAFCATSIGR